MRLPSLSYLIAFIALPLIAHGEPVDDCDRLAALEADPSAMSEPVAFIDIQPERVVEACTDALNAGSDGKPRFLLQRARGYLRGGQVELALSDLNASHELGYPAATFGLATAYFLGDDIERDDAIAESLFLEAYEGGVIWAASGLASLYGDPASELGLVTFSCRSKCSFKPLSARRRADFFHPMLNAFDADYRSRLCK